MDSIADMMVRLNNGLRVKKETVEMPHSRFKEEIGKLLVAEGYVDKCEVLTRFNKKQLRLVLKYAAGKRSVLEGLRRVSRPGKRIYVGADRVPRIRSGFGTALISTPKGLMTDAAAREQKVGGEVICYVW
ncbi:MAG: 30S ribosomal protein S8 [Candidatus Margulisbacteria bacterium]|jgi:small subunit ribosomal protein S8|nr:30S ribosomal protein S8 [Candidatus Margulisiibacteriota bacterium]